jgi:hypothetical protein
MNCIEALIVERAFGDVMGQNTGSGAKFSRRAKRGNFLVKSGALRLWDCAEYRLVVVDIPTCRGLRKICT